MAAPTEAPTTFAGLTEQLHYLGKADLKKVREAYKFADRPRYTLDASVGGPVPLLDGLSFTYSHPITSIQTRGGFVQQHWGDVPTKLSFQAVTGGFKRLYSGLSNITGGGIDLGGTRRETLAYDKHLDLLALFRSNGTFTDANGIPVYDGAIKLTFDGGEYIGWFETFEKQENAQKPFMFDQSFNFVVKQELQRFRSLPYTSPLIRGTVTGNLQSLDFVPQ
jgi:hypothetical protein